jgi:hypothetical protein
LKSAMLSLSPRTYVPLRKTLPHLSRAAMYAVVAAACREWRTQHRGTVQRASRVARDPSSTLLC